MDNPAFTFYSLLRELWESKDFRPGLAKNLLEIYKSNGDRISLPRVTKGGLRLWHKDYNRQSGILPRGVNNMAVVAKHCFADLGNQMRSIKVRELFLFWDRFQDCYGEPIYIHVRALGDAAVKVVTNDDRWAANLLARDKSGKLLVKTRKWSDLNRITSVTISTPDKKWLQELVNGKPLRIFSGRPVHVSMES